MSSLRGLMPYKTVPKAAFARDIKALKKQYKSKRDQSEFSKQVTQIVQKLESEPRPSTSRMEPWPSKTLDKYGEFRKLTFHVYKRQGESGEGRLMYLIDENDKRIDLINLFTKKQYSKRPSDKEIRDRLTGN